MPSGPTTQEPGFRRFVALGDSTTEGLVDLHPDGTYRGWADRLAERLSAISPGIEYANLAVRGRKVPQIRDEQLAPALELEPDLASVIGGVNDILRPSVELETIAEDIEAMVSSLRNRGATVLMLTYPDLTETIVLMAERIRARIDAFNVHLREIAERNQAHLIDLEGSGVNHPRFWAIDRLHANELGHARIAALAAQQLGLEVAQSDLELPDSVEPLPVHRRIGADAVWATRHLAPWIKRRMLGQSSGDGISAKRPVPKPLGPS